VISKPYTLTLTLSLKGEGIFGWTLMRIYPCANIAGAQAVYKSMQNTFLRRHP
jgi:hypothetical protein